MGSRADFLSFLLRNGLALILAIIFAVGAFVAIDVRGVRSDIAVVFRSPVDGAYGHQLTGNATLIAQSVLRERETRVDAIGSSVAEKYPDASAFSVTTYGSDLTDIVKENRTALNEILRVERTHYGPQFEIFFDVVGNAYKVTKWPLVGMILAISALVGLLISRLVMPRGHAHEEEYDFDDEPEFAQYDSEEYEAVETAQEDADDEDESDDSDSSDEASRGTQEKISAGRSELAKRWGKQSAAERLFAKRDTDHTEQETVEALSKPHHDVADSEDEILPQLGVDDGDEDSLDDHIVASIETKKSSKPTPDKKHYIKNPFATGVSSATTAKSAPGNLPVVDASDFGEQLHEDNVAFNELMQETQQDDFVLPVQDVSTESVDFDDPESEILEHSQEKQQKTIESAVTDITGDDTSEPTEEELKKRLNKLLKGEI